MMLLSGYTLGFFFPKQAKHLAATPEKTDHERKVRCEARELEATRPDAESESREVPAAFYFYHHF